MLATLVGIPHAGTFRAASFAAALALGISSLNPAQNLHVRDPHSLSVVATTPVIADIARNVAGDRAKVISLVPATGDPHSYEPTLGDVRKIAHADLLLSNGLLLEEASLTRALVTHQGAKARSVALAEEAPRYGAQMIPLVEDLSLETIWLGFRTENEDVAHTGGESQKTSSDSSSSGKGSNLGSQEDSSTRAPRSLRIQAIEMEGPGTLAAFLTGTFGQAVRYLDSSQGIDESDALDLPLGSHTHMSWAFSTPGIYRLTLAASILSSEDKAEEIGRSTFTFAVGTPPPAHMRVLDHGHMDITASERSGLYLKGDDQEGEGTQTRYSSTDSVILVPDTALSTVPGDPSFRFLGKSGAETYLLAQAVIGKHVHGEIDPHMWLSPEGGRAYVQAIRDGLSAVDPQGSRQYDANARAYLAKIDETEAYMRSVLSRIPPQARKLITTHDGYGYLAHDFGLSVAGFLVPNPSLEPSTRGRIALQRTISTLAVPALFLEPTSTRHQGELMSAASSAGVPVCRIYSEAFDEDVGNYLQMLTTNARNLSTCLNRRALPATDFESWRESKARMFSSSQL